MRDIVYGAWSTTPGFENGIHQGTAVHDDAVVIGETAGQRAYADPHADGPPVTYECAAWISPEVAPGFPVTELIPSWNAATPQGTWVEIEIRASQDEGPMSRWYVLARWAETDTDIHPTTLGGQDDVFASVETDILTARPPRTTASYQVRVSLMRRPGSTETPRVRLVAMMASNVPSGPSLDVSPVGAARGTALDVPAYSQQVHRGEYPQWDNGGASWCSPTSTSMVLAYWGVGPGPEDYAWVDPVYQDRWVDYAARHVFDHGYRGAGNWTFNTAYAARYGLTAYVTRLRSLTEAERFIAAGIPLIVTVSFKKDALEGAGYDTQGHLLTIIGFDESGNVISNDPASHTVPSNDEVRTTYDREQFENAWLGSAGGITYVIHPPGYPLPEPPAQPNW